MRIARTLVAASLLTSAVPALAESITWIGTFEGVSDGIYYTSDDAPDPGSFFLANRLVTDIPRFDPSLGTLTDLTLTVGASASVAVEMGGEFEAYETDPGASFSGDVHLQGDYGFYYFGGGGFTDLFVEFFDGSASCGGEPGEGGCGTSLFVDELGLAGSVSILDRVDPSDFTGSGFVDALTIGVFFPVTADFSTFDNVDFAGLDFYFDVYPDGIDGGGVEITYDFVPVPLPPAAVLLAPACFVLLRVGRRRA